MTATVVAILDRDDWQANTDVIVIADDFRRRLTWIPRDLWSVGLKDRVNAAFRLGGCARLVTVLTELGFPCDAAVVLRRGATERALATVRVTVPVKRKVDHWYPLTPTRPIEEGRKRISFQPPEEMLAGERVHQWIGARKSPNGRVTDFDRIERQKVLLRVLLAQGFAFRDVIGDADLVRSAGDDPFSSLSRIDSSWTLRTFRAVVGSRVDGNKILIPAGLPRRIYRKVRAGAQRRLANSQRAARFLTGEFGRFLSGDWSRSTPMAWGRHVSRPFRAKVRNICTRLQLDPNSLMAVIAFETIRTFSTGIVNPSSGATGLIQFIPKTAAELGTTTAALAAMSEVEQLDYVERYLAPFAGRMVDPASAYMAVLWPDAVSAPLSTVLFAAPDDTYMRNRGLDTDNDGKVTKAEAAALVLQLLDEGLRPENIG